MISTNSRFFIEASTEWPAWTGHRVGGRSEEMGDRLKVEVGPIGKIWLSAQFEILEQTLFEALTVETLECFGWAMRV